MTDVELMVSMPIVNPETKGVSRTFAFAGKVDKYERTALGQITDYKAVSQISRFIHTIKVGNQPYLYAAAVKHMTGTIPLIIEYRLVEITGIKLCGKDEGDPAAYEKRVVQWYMDKPEKVRPLEIILNPARVEHAIQALWDTTKRVLDNRAKGKWRMNEKACFQYNRPCEFCGLCTATADGADVEQIIEEQFEKKEHVHPELGISTIGGSGLGISKTEGHSFFGSREIMTYSRMTTVNLCEAMDHWKYERELQKPSGAPEAMWLGTAMHLGLEAETPAESRTAIKNLRDQFPAIGDMVKHLDQQEARANAMVRVARLRWP